MFHKRAKSASGCCSSSLAEHLGNFFCSSSEMCQRAHFWSILSGKRICHRGDSSLGRREWSARPARWELTPLRDNNRGRGEDDYPAELYGYHNSAAGKCRGTMATRSRRDDCHTTIPSTPNLHGQGQRPTASTRKRAPPTDCKVPAQSTFHAGFSRLLEIWGSSV